MSEEKNLYPPPEHLTAHANVKGINAYRELYRQAMDNPDKFWSELACQELSWFKPPQSGLEWKPPIVRWFADGKLNACYNCVDRHLATERKTKPAILWEGEPGDARVITYEELHGLVVRFASVLQKLGYKKGDRAIIYMPMVPELPVALLACARLGIIHSVVFGGFSAEALKTRIQDLDATLVITADGGWRRGKEVKLKTAVDEALRECPKVSNVIVHRRTGSETAMTEGRDAWWHELEKSHEANGDCPPEELEAEHPLFVLYTSGTTGKPKGILHTTAGYLLQTSVTTKWVFDLHENDVYWCTADVGWVTGHSYVVYGPLAAGASVVMYEGAPDFPAFDRLWQIVETLKVTIFYTSPTAIRALVKQGERWPDAHNLSSLRILGSVGEPINPAAWEWYHRVIGKGRCPIVDTWWQTETGGILISPLPGATSLKPGSATLPLPGIVPDIVDSKGQAVGANNREGYLVIRKPWPSMIRTIWGDPKRYEEQYWSRVPGAYFTGDAARRDDDGYYWILGRVDDVMNVSGHRLSTMEVESSLVHHPAVAEAAVVGKPHEITGQAVCAFVTLKSGSYDRDQLGKELRQWVAKEIGSFARPEEIRFSDALPKTRSGKIMRRLLREIVTSDSVTGDVTTLEDLSVVAALSAHHDED